MVANKPINMSAKGTVADEHRKRVVDNGEYVKFTGPDGFSIGFIGVSPFDPNPIDWQHPVAGPCKLKPEVKQYPYSVILSGMVTEPPPGKPPGPIIIPPPPVGPGSRKRR